MVSLSLMARLVEAVRPDARLVLVGDPEQLASVEPGAVLGDIVGPALDGMRMTAEFGSRLARVDGGSPRPAPDGPRRRGSATAWWSCGPTTAFVERWPIWPRRSGPATRIGSSGCCRQEIPPFDGWNWTMMSMSLPIG